MRIFRVLTLVISFGILLQAGPITYSVTNLGLLPGGTFTTGWGISSNGLATGYGDTSGGSLPGGTHAFLWNGSIHDIGPLASPQAFGYGINSSGYVAGYAFTSDFSQYNAFLYQGGTLTAIPTLGGTNNVANGINNSGTVVGWSENSDNLQTAFLYSGTTADIGFPSSLYSWANAINSTGLVVGAWNDGTNPNSAFLYNPATNTWTDLGVPAGYAGSEALAIADSGLIAGFVTDGSSKQGFVSNGSGFQLLGTLGAGDSVAFGVNSSGTVVGGSNSTAFVYLGSTLYDLNTLLDGSGAGWVLGDAMAINDAGQIVGTGLLDGAQTAYLLTPAADQSQVPEPGTWVLLASGLAAGALLRRRHTR
jgi:probable HAF family extracellular repeat protein